MTVFCCCFYIPLLQNEYKHRWTCTTQPKLYLLLIHWLSDAYAHKNDKYWIMSSIQIRFLPFFFKKEKAVYRVQLKFKKGANGNPQAEPYYYLLLCVLRYVCETETIYKGYSLFTLSSVLHGDCLTSILTIPCLWIYLCIFMY